MRLQVKGKNVEVTPSIREYPRKLAKLGKQLAEQTQVEWSCPTAKPSIAASQVAEATVFTKGRRWRARGFAGHEASIDQLVDKLERQ